MTTNKPATLFRAGITRAPYQALDDSGGDFYAGLIRGAAICTRGEALGHGLWLDDDFITDVVARINEAGPRGLKVRFTHPDMSGDGLARKLGVVKNAVKVGNVALADVHIQKAAHKTPDGNLAEYVMLMALETPEQFGMSIVFEQDDTLTELHTVENTSASGLFVSPDEDNRNNLRHARLSSLAAADVVDEPAANPDGLFYRDDNADEAAELAAYAFGISDKKPELVTLSKFDPDRVQAFATRFLARHNLHVVACPEDSADEDEDESTGESGDPDMIPDESTEDEDTEESIAPSAVDDADSEDEDSEANPMSESTTAEVALSRDDIIGELADYTQRFGAENGTAWFTAGHDLQAAYELHCETLTETLQARDNQIAELQQRIDQAAAGSMEEEAAEFGSSQRKQAGRKRSGPAIRINGKDYAETDQN